MSGEQPMNRREFVRTLARGAALGALALGGGWLVGRSGRRCFYGSACGACQAYSDCTLPERQVQAGPHPATGRLTEQSRPGSGRGPL